MYRFCQVVLLYFEAWYTLCSMKYRTGQIVEGTISGIQPYGAFVKLDDSICGLIHISEISEGYVRDVGHFVKVGDTVKVKVIDFDAEAMQARLSLKALRPVRVRGGKDRISPRATLPEGSIGFRSLSDRLEGWITEAEKEIK